MNEFWNFAGHYWWLVFPLGGALVGVISSAHSAMQKSAKLRHKRKLETMKLKAELRHGTPSALPAQQPAGNDLLGHILKDHDDVTARWLDYELDVAKLIAFPAMSDGRQPLTAAFLRAKKTADTLRPAATDTPSAQQISDYMKAVGDYAVAFEVAERDARRLRDSTFSEEERKRLERAQQLLKVAVDDSATQAERNVAYKRVREELDGLILLSTAAVEVLEKKVAPALTSPETPEH